VVQRRGRGWALCPSSPPFSRSLPTPLLSLPGSAPHLPRPGPPLLPCPPPPLGAPCPLSPPRLPRGGRVEGLGGGRVPPCHRLRRRSSPVAAPPPARCPRRVSGRGGAAAGPRGAFPGSGPPLPGGPRSLGSRGAPAVVRRVPPPALDGSLSVRRMSARTSALPLRVLSSPTAPQASGPGPAPLLSFPASVPPSSRALARSCPASRRSPPPALRGEKGAWVAGAGRDAGGGRWFGGRLGRREGVRSAPAALGGWGGVVGWWRGAGGGTRRAFLRHGPAASGFVALRVVVWPGPGFGVEAVAWGLVPSPASPVPHPLSRYLARPGAEV